jgi:tetratricopeptide (TPR) repeat protein
MAAARLEKLRSFIAARPDDPFPRYALALEHRNAGEHEQAWATFQDLIVRFPDYTAAYLHAGNALVALARTDEARVVWRKGVEKCLEKCDSHAHGELESALGAVGG